MLVNKRKPRRRGVQLDLFSPVDDAGNLLVSADGVVQMLYGMPPPTAQHVRDVEESDGMCGERFIETGWPWERR